MTTAAAVKAAASVKTSSAVETAEAGLSASGEASRHAPMIKAAERARMAWGWAVRRRKRMLGD